MKKYVKTETYINLNSKYLDEVIETIQEVKKTLQENGYEEVKTSSRSGLNLITRRKETDQEVLDRIKCELREEERDKETEIIERALYKQLKGKFENEE